MPIFLNEGVIFDKEMQHCFRLSIIIDGFLLLDLLILPTIFTDGYSGNSPLR